MDPASSERQGGLSLYLGGVQIVAPIPCSAGVLGQRLGCNLQGESPASSKQGRPTVIRHDSLGVSILNGPPDRS